MTTIERRQRLAQEVALVREEIATSTSREQTASTSGATDNIPGSSVPVRNLSEQVVLAEDLALRELEAEFDRPILRQVAVTDTGVDGVFQLPDREVAVEVKYTRSVDWSRFAHAALGIAASFSRKGRARPVTTLLAIVADGLSKAERDAGRQSLERALSNTPTGVIKVRVFDFTELKQKFGIESFNYAAPTGRT